MSLFHDGIDETPKHWKMLKFDPSCMPKSRNLSEVKPSLSKQQFKAVLSSCNVFLCLFGLTSELFFFLAWLKLSFWCVMQRQCGIIHRGTLHNLLEKMTLFFFCRAKQRAQSFSNRPIHVRREMSSVGHCIQGTHTVTALTTAVDAENKSSLSLKKRCQHVAVTVCHIISSQQRSLCHFNS